MTTDRPLRILITTDVYPPGCGGSGWSTDALVRALGDHGHPVEVLELAPAARGITSRTYDGVEVCTLGLAGARTPTARLGAREYSHEPVRRWVAARLAEEPVVDVVHAQHLHSGPGALQAARRAGRAAVLTVRDHWPVCLHGLTWWGGGACAGCTAPNLVGCMNEYYGLPRAMAAAMIPWARRRLRARAAAPGLAHRTVVPSATLARRLEERLGPLGLEVIPNIVDPGRSARFADRAEPTERPARYLLAAGKLNAGKGFDELVDWLGRAGNRLPLVVAGTGELAEDLVTEAEARGLELRLLGWLDAPELLAWMRGAEALLLPSRVEEALARTLLEALSVGTPVISWPVGSSREVVEEGVNGWVVSSVQELRSALDSLSDPATRERMGAAARSTAERRFAPAAVLPRLREVYEAAMREASA